MPRDIFPAEGSYCRSRSPERELWASVIYQALLDATSKGVASNDGGASSVPNEHERDEARHWLLRGTNFEEVCDYAGINAWCLRDYARTLALRGWLRNQTLRVLNAARGA